MRDINNVKLEILRAGPSHNQMLSPLTPYVAVCGGAGPVTINMPFEHRHFLTGLRLLRYEDGCEGLEPIRQAEVRKMGEAVGDVLGRIPSLLAELSAARCEGDKLIHLRLSLSAAELSLIPFETAIAPPAYPGSGTPLFLQPRMPISITREIRRGRPLPVFWDQAPRILFVFANPPGTATVPAEAHLAALREALDPWVDRETTPEGRMASFKKRVTVLDNPTLDQLRQACAAEAYTHVHILAHGVPYKFAGDDRYGLALSSTLDPMGMDVVDGTRLAIALATSDPSGARRSCPTVVSLATCDSAQENTVLTPGGSIAHELHMAGIPWVFASQFPLWMSASTLFVETLYKGLMVGDDPRWVLYQVRQHLRASLPQNHDWASIVAYATLPKDFEQQLERFRDRQMRAALDVRFRRIDRMVVPDEDAQAVPFHLDELDSLAQEVRAWCDRWNQGNHANPVQQAERVGLAAAYEKRIGLAYWRSLASGAEGVAQRKGLVRNNIADAFRAAIDKYRMAVEAQPLNHWAVTQYLSMIVADALREASQHPAGKRKNGARLPEFSGVRSRYLDWWSGAFHMAQWQRQFGADRDKIWACSSVLELALLNGVYQGESLPKDLIESFVTTVATDLRELCLEAKDSFPVSSTLRQLRRYRDFWTLPVWDDWVRLAITQLEKP